MTHSPAPASTPITVDVHAHAIVPSALSSMSAAHPDYGPELVEADGERYLHYPGRAGLGPLPDAIFDLGVRLSEMARQEVDLQVVAIPPPNFHYHVPPHVARDFATIQNDALLELSDAEPDRVHVLATLPLQAREAALVELGRVAEFGVVRGVQIGTNVGGRDLDDPYFQPVWEALEAHDLPIMLHPDQRAIAGAERLSDYYLQNLVGLPMESTIAAARLIFGGVVERHPELRFGFVHGGGFSPFQVGRWDHGWQVRTEPRREIARPPSDYYRTFYFDTLTHDPAALAMLGQRVGWDHVLLGSDFPFDMAAPDPVGRVRSAHLESDVEEAVLGRNATRFLRPL